MTTQTKQYIDLSDIVAFRFDCKQCDAALSLPLSDNRTKLALAVCPNCKTVWAQRQGIAYDEIINEFKAHLKRAAEIMGQQYSDPLGFSMVLEIKMPSTS